MARWDYRYFGFRDFRAPCRRWMRTAARVDQPAGGGLAVGFVKMTAHR